MRMRVGETYYNVENVRATLSISFDKPGVMVRQPLARAGNALADMD